MASVRVTVFSEAHFQYVQRRVMCSHKSVMFDETAALKTRNLILTAYSLHLGLTVWKGIDVGKWTHWLPWAVHRYLT